MKHTKRAFATMIFAITVGCTGQLSPVSPTVDSNQAITIHHSRDTRAFVDLLLPNESDFQETFRLDFEEAQHQTLLNQILSTDISHFISHHNPLEANDLDLWSMPLAQDGIAIVTHPDNPINTLSRQELQGIYRGFISNWADLGGRDNPITIYSREDVSGLYLEFNRLVMGQQRITPNAQILASSQLMIEGIRQDDNAIGYIPISLLQDDIKAFSIEDISPTIPHIIDNTYPFRMTIYAIGQAELSTREQDLLRRLQTLDYITGNLNYAPLFP